jgi:SAM-dependent methyltransferase
MDARAVAQRRHRVFRRIFDLNLWGNCESVSGEGSTLERTAAIRADLPPLLARYGVRSVLDAPCGDFFWMKEVTLDVDSYVGADIVPELITRNIERHSNRQRRFIVCDLVDAELPRADLVFCRDCLVHLSYAETRRALDNFRRSGATWLLTTTFSDRRDNHDIKTGDWRPINLERAPYGFPPAAELINERCDEVDEVLGAFADKSLGLWRLADLPQW